MWSPRYFARRLFPLRYFPAGGEAVLADPSPRIVTLEGSYVPALTLTGSVLPAVLSGSYTPVISLEGSP